MFLDFYGLREQPFGTTPDPRYLYLSPVHKEALASLVCGIETGVGFLGLVAEPGTGKTTLLLQLLENFRHSLRTAFVFQTQCDSRQLMRYILDDLEMDADTNDIVTMHRQFRDVLARESEAGRRVLVVIDEAQNLEESTLETLRLLSNFETPDAKLLHIVLSGQPDLADKLRRPNLIQLRQRISALIRLEALPTEEINRYINYRLQVAGYRGAPLFTPDAYTLIADQSGGIPRIINNLCLGALAIGCGVGKRLIDASILEEAAADLQTDGLGAKSLLALDRSLQQRGEKVEQAAIPGAKAEADDAATGPTAFDRVDLVQLRTIAAEIVLASRVVRAALPDRPALASHRKTDVVTCADTRVVGLPSCETEAVGNSTEVRHSTPGALNAPGANHVATRTHQKRPFLTSRRWIGAIAALVIVTSLIIRTLGKRNFELPSVSRTEAPHKPKTARIPKAAQGVTDKHYPTQSLGQQRTGAAQDAKSPFRTPQQDRRTVNSTARQTTTGSSARETVVGENPTPGTAIDESSGQLPNVESGSAMSSARAAGANSRAVNSTAQTTTQSSVRETVVDENPAPGTAVDESSGKLPNVDKVPNTEDKADSVSESVMSSVPTAGVDSRGGLVANIVRARLIREVKPIYPPAALEAQIQGSVVLHVIVDINGAVRDVRFISGPAVLAPAAIDAIEHWRYRPSYLNGRPHESETLVTVKFSLR